MNLFCNFKYELIADDSRRSALSRFAGCRRAVFNKALELQNDRKAKSEKPISYLEMAHLLMEWKQTEEMAFLKEAPSQALQQTLMDLDRAIKDTFRKKGDPAKKRWPRFKANLNISPKKRPWAQAHLRSAGRPKFSGGVHGSNNDLNQCLCLLHK